MSILYLPQDLEDLGEEYLEEKDLQQVWEVELQWQEGIYYHFQ
jgi:hypothetical protein